MSIFVEDSETVEVKVHYKAEGKQVKIMEKPGDDVTTLTMTFRQPNFVTSQRLVSSSTTIDSEGAPAVNLLTLQSNMIYFLAKEWDAKDAKGEIMPLTNENIGRLKVEVARALITGLSKEVGQLM